MIHIIQATHTTHMLKISSPAITSEEKHKTYLPRKSYRYIHYKNIETTTSSTYTPESRVNTILFHLTLRNTPPSTTVEILANPYANLRPQSMVPRHIIQVLPEPNYLHKAPSWHPTLAGCLQSTRLKRMVPPFTSEPFLHL